MFILSLILAFPDYNLPFELHTDTSNKALGYVQKYPDERTRVISYGGCTLSKAEKNYCIIELELLALVDRYQRFLIYLRDREFKVYTDHSNLQYVMNNNKLSPRATRWALKLSAFKMRIVHKPGKDSTVPDAKSRLWPEVSVCTTSEPYNHVKIARLQREDRDLQQLISYLEAGEDYQFDVPTDIAASNATHFFLEENGVLFQLTTPTEPHHAAKLLVIPNKLRKKITLGCHNHP